MAIFHICVVESIVGVAVKRLTSAHKAQVPTKIF